MSVVGSRAVVVQKSGLAGRLIRFSIHRCLGCCPLNSSILTIAGVFGAVGQEKDGIAQPSWSRRCWDFGVGNLHGKVPWF